MRKELDGNPTARFNPLSYGMPARQVPRFAAGRNASPLAEAAVTCRGLGSRHAS